MPKLYRTLCKKSLKELEYKQGKNDELFIFYGKAVKLNFNKTQKSNYLNVAIKVSNSKNIRIGIIVGNQNYFVDSYACYNIAVVGYLVCKLDKNGEEYFNIIPYNENYEYILYESINNK